ncbi:hypothetical protein SteCoe_10648 [Stentor coeruleus]|uniref:Uncharacterized protein n=1 Tax=Stentor coeruleus TaxID=5963 RepID=A0A1R2CF43_9CILI|nr:hypothetical protein SteCoe_10648 [Stentor coeruleus]
MNTLVSKEYKIAVLGSSNVGKSSLCLQFARNQFPENYEPDVPDYYRKHITLDGENTIVHIIDTAGQEKDIIEFISQAHGYLVVFDITRSNSLIEAEYYYQLIRKTKNCLEIPLVLVGNKLDSNNFRQVSQENAQKIANQWKCKFYEVSAKNKINLDLVFIEGARLIRQEITRTRSGEIACCRCCVM